MSRTKRATIAAGFGYIQFGLSLVVAIALAPLLLSQLGVRTWGLWLATGEILAYAGMVDLGVLGVLPLLVAEADGGGDRTRMRRFVSNGLVVGAVIGLAYALIGIALWQLLPSVLRFTAADRAAVGPPLALIVATTALTYPLRIYPATLIGLQDMTFFGTIRVVQAVLNLVVTIALLMNGYGLWALAWASVVPTAAGLIASAIRLRRIAPDLMTDWPAPTLSEITPLVTNGFGVWLAGFGWLLLSSSNALVITFLGHPEWVPIFSCTAKVSLIATQLVWLMPDAGLVGLAQLYGEAKSTPRVRHVVGLLQQVHLVLAGAAACVILAFNPTFVTRWVGGPLFGGLTLNALLAGGVVLYSLVHGLMTAASTLGNRVEVGVVTIANGAIQIVAAIVLGRWLGLPGIALGGLLAVSLTSLPAGVLLLRRTIQLTVRGLVLDCVGPWTFRMIPIAVGATAVGIFQGWLGFWLAGVSAVVIALAYIWRMRPLYPAVLALDPTWTPWLAMVRLVPSLPSESTVRLKPDTTPVDPTRVRSVRL
jgi:O-antigen/teichoic acid export membrane protein